MSDELIAALARQAAECFDKYDAFEVRALDYDGAAHTYLKAQAERIWDRYELLKNALCAVRATGPAGAMLQLGALTSLMDLEGGPHQSGLDTARRCALHSIFSGVANAAGVPKAFDAFDSLQPVHDPFIVDVDAYLHIMKAYFEANEIELIEKRARA